MNSLRALRLLLRGGAHMARGWWTIRTRFPALTQREREARVQAWAAAFLRLWGIGLEVHGTPPAHGPLLLVANHISWLDILVLHAAGFCRFVSKAQVRHWPLIGPLASGAGTLYNERESRRDAMRGVHHMAESLGRGEVVAVFPEGTTSDGSGVLPFHANLLQAAISAGAPAQPVALRFVDAVTRAPSLAPIYIGDDSLVASVWRTLTARGVTAVVRYGAPQAADDRGRREWSADLRQAVGELMSD
ncbi:MAG: lysophospholipid acyltransferase family protein [Burkholderiaceae bacterium]